MNTAFLLFALHLPERRMFNEFGVRETFVQRVNIITFDHGSAFLHNSCCGQDCSTRSSFSRNTLNLSYGTCVPKMNSSINAFGSQKYASGVYSSSATDTSVYHASARIPAADTRCKHISHKSFVSCIGVPRGGSCLFCVNRTPRRRRGCGSARRPQRPGRVRRRYTFCRPRPPRSLPRAVPAASDNPWQARRPPR